MPGETKIKRCPQGWFDVDHPTTFYRTRAEVRDVRRSGASSLPSRVAAVPRTATVPNVTVINVNVSPGATTDDLTSLEYRLFDRLIYDQGVSETDALSIITNNGYNAAASYGHMRAAGANHFEAEFVIGLGSPDASLAYGQARANGLDHIDALKEALRDYGDADD